jgi:hypothetical protein
MAKWTEFLLMLYKKKEKSLRVPGTNLVISRKTTQLKARKEKKKLFKKNKKALNSLISLQKRRSLIDSETDCSTIHSYLKSLEQNLKQ